MTKLQFMISKTESRFIFNNKGELILPLLKYKVMYALDFIKGFYKIQSLFSEEQTIDIGNYAYQYAKFSRVFFKIVKFDKDRKIVIIEVRQDKKTTKTPYFSHKELTEKCRSLFCGYFVDYTMHINPFIYTEAPPEIVTPQWIQTQMNKHKIGNKQLVQDLGIAKAEISALINGHVDMSIRTKAMFYYYFEFQKLKK